MHLQTVHAEEKQTIIVSSLKFEDTKDLQIQSSPGKPISALTKFTGINNKKFQLYDVTDLFVSFRQANSAINDSTLDTKFIASLTKDQLATHSFISNTTQTTTYGDGTMVFNVIKEDEQGYHVYLLKEIGNGDISSPMLIRLPVIDQGNELNPIYLYTKNVIKVDPVFKPELIKTINDKKDSYTFGDDIVYSVDFTIPSTVEQAKSVELLDTYDRGLQKKSLTKLSIDGQLVPNDLYTERVSDQHTSYSFKPSSLTKYIGKTLTLEYTLQLINSTVEKTQYNNTIKLMISEKEILRDHETISTGGKHFKKIDLATKKPLADASFYLTNETGQISRLSLAIRDCPGPFSYF
ncbi:hypothetical protein RV04_GL001922 [Enterococcus hermanniensis]|uniref:Gram-positive pilin subunit D1 N-terminal domain-containing protein n=2 Tax=Enterococcus hermanniensis TaxID=249189 RepID=A0A1L8TN24_9ENTE|nr:hypothetical protein RV04_GL001922 [Enterococcus hermanniensis]